ncbi:MAG: hypothetical protein L6Q71_05505, partial [Planctomycetes bacterium]|nr:hypothetical protein [Planctomycetota bacterium]
DMRLKAWNVTNWSLNFDVPIVDGDGKESDDPKDKQSLRNVTLSGDQSSLYVASLDWPVKMFDAVTGEKRGEPFGDKPAWDVEPLPGSSRVVTIHTGGAIKVWEPSASEPLATADADWPRGNISDIDVSDDGSLIGISNWNGLTSLWTFDGQNLVKVAPKDQTIEVDGEVYTLAYTSGDFLGKITGLSVIDDGKAFIAATDYGTITLNDIATGHIMSDLRATDELYPVSGFSIGPGNRIATAHTFGRANVWNWKEDKHLVRMKEPLKEHVSAIAWSAGGNAIVTADWAGKVMLWDVATGQYLRTFESPADDVRIFALAVIDQNVIAGDDNGMLHVWDIVSGTLLFEFKAHPHWITDIAIPPVRDQYDFFTSCANGAIVAWKLGSGKAEQVLVLDQSNPDGCGQIRISPDGTFLASTHNDGARIWDLTPNYQAFGERVKAFKHGHNGPTTAIAITPDSKRLLTGGKDKTVILWKVKD